MWMEGGIATVTGIGQFYYKWNSKKKKKTIVAQENIVQCWKVLGK